MVNPESLSHGVFAQQLRGDDRDRSSLTGHLSALRLVLISVGQVLVWTHIIARLLRVPQVMRMTTCSSAAPSSSPRASSLPFRRGRKSV